MEYEIRLQEFAGPLDLLLHLIKKHEIDIFDIPISQITDQYLEYINQMKEYNMDYSSEFVVMAAQLLQIKSNLLLPPEEDEEGNEIDPRLELAEKIYEYKIYKEISEYLQNQGEISMQVHYKDPEYWENTNKIITEIDVESLFQAFKRVLAKSKVEKVENILHKIERETVRVEDKMRDIISLLEDKREISFSSLFDTTISRTKIIVTFLALLELIKNNFVLCAQERICGEIVIWKIR
ncbi:condensin subunit ScpA [Alkalibaculum bacchi]|uniref:Segregation and condensation protein A n=1 Tax=Alkalibaculum bacchi TaxID=645887 RepID=A0A366I2L5_9FIRM|nr:segregation/condensation protein A [Alkalibaculum bacchi]RBP61828.1 condensin subunit ScpA [Alkalibaculum bacchi]